MTKRLEYSTLATADLAAIWRYSEREWGRDQARKYLAAIEAHCNGMVVGGAVTTTRTIGGIAFERIRVASHAIFALDEGYRILIVRVLHVRQDAEANLAADRD